MATIDRHRQTRVMQSAPLNVCLRLLSDQAAQPYEACEYVCNTWTSPACSEQQQKGSRVQL